MSFLVALFNLVIYSIACLGMGRIAVNIFSSRKDSALQPGVVDVATCFLLGQGLLANVWVFIALPGIFSPFAVWGSVTILSIAGCVLNLKSIKVSINQIANIVKEFKDELWGWKAVILATVILWLAWFNYLGRPLESSASRFYMALPKVISSAERLKVLPGYEEVASLGLQGEMQFAVFMTMGSPQSIQPFSWLTLTLGCVLLLALGGQTGLDRRGQWLALAMIFSSSAVILLSGSGKSDIYGAAFAFASFYWAFHIGEKNRIQAPILTGLFGGLAVIAKISYAASFLPCLAVILIWKILFQSGKKNFASQTLPFVVIGLSAIFITIQLPIKNQILFNNPFAPYGMKDIFDQVWYGSETIQRIYLTIPFALTFGAYWGQAGGLTPLALIYLPLFFFLPNPRRMFGGALSALSIAALLGLTSWFIFHPSVFAPRYFLACLLLLVIPIAKTAILFAEQRVANARLLQIVTTLFVLLTSLSYTTFLFVPGANLQSLLRGEPNCEAEAMRCKISAEVNSVLEPGQRIFTNTRHRYWLRPDLIQCAANTLEIENYLAMGTSEQRWGYLIGRGFRSVLLENRKTPLPDTIRKDLLDVPEWLSVDIVENSSRLFYFHINSNGETPPVLFVCEQSPRPAWGVFEIPSR